jgi:hypothetical protein
MTSTVSVPTCEGEAQVGKDHTYNTYARGCRCLTCKAAKAEYMRVRRAEARDLAAFLRSRKPLHPFGSGSVAQYEERGCRCYECVQAATVKRMGEYDRRSARASA